MTLVKGISINLANEGSFAIASANFCASVLVMIDTKDFFKSSAASTDVINRFFSDGTDDMTA